MQRRYEECMACRILEHVADKRLGIEGRYSLGLRRLAVRAAVHWSFDSASKNLQEFCGIQLSSNTVRRLANDEAVPMRRWHANDTEVQSSFSEASGDTEFTTDGTCVNTVDGWREMRIGILSKRHRGKYARPDPWLERHLPKPHQVFAFAYIEGKEPFRRHWEVQAKRLGVSPKELSVVADGSHWIWDSVELEFGKVEEVLDIFHALEHLSSCGKEIYKLDQKGYEQWREETTLDLLWYGYEGIESRLARLSSASLDPASQQAIAHLRTYFEYHRSRVNYRKRLSEGHSIGSGQVEGACKNLIGRRLKQTGARWKLRRVENMAALCSVMYSNDWNRYWKRAK